MLCSRAMLAMSIGFTLACGGGSDAESASETSESGDTRVESAADLPDPCGLVTEEELSELLWRGMEANQRSALEARNATHTFTKRVESSSSKEPISGIGDQAFYMSNAAYGRRGEVGVEVVDFHAKEIEIELLKRAVARLP